MIITRYENYNNVDVYFPEYNWTFYGSYYQNFKSGSLKCDYERRYYNNGYIGEGNAPLTIGSKKTEPYKIWLNLLKRCYDYRLYKKQPTYVNCIVCEEWLCYNTFYKWYKENYYEVENERVALDKDILCKGNKIYSPETCVFVPQSINNLFVKRDAARGEYPIGVSYDKRANIFVASCSNSNKEHIRLGSFDNPKDAFNEYKRFKEITIKKVADLYKDIIPDKLYEALYRYEVEITD
ncbi:hypothetical protein [Terrisporobacter sp.]|uniref:hypothetical protein n=1 Tax=Terrisporobacter sp. TaxID=1965305 RepID=UPI00289AC7FE|nr:hypothetical protein [Terrisporobacter sp.]